MTVLSLSAGGVLIKYAAAGLLVGVTLGCMVGAALMQEIADRRRREAERKAKSIAKHQPPHGFNKSSLYLHNDHLKDEF